MGLKIGVCIRFKNPAPWARPWETVYREHLEYGRVADQLGFDGIWVPEHHCVDTGYNPAPFLSLTALAGVTERCWLGTQPLLLPLHNPVLVAEEAAVLDVISGGRLILGVGAGYRPGDFAALGKEKRERGARMEEGVDLLLKALSGREAFDYDGAHFKARGVNIFPRPFQDRTPEVQMAVRSAPAAQRAGRYGLTVNLHGRENMARFGPAVVEARRDAGLDPWDVTVSLLRSGFLAEDRARAASAIRDYLVYDGQEYDVWQNEASVPDPDDVRIIEARRASTGEPGGLYTPEDWIQAIEGDVAAVAAQGFKADWVNVTLWPPGMPLPQAIDCLERFANDVLAKIDRG